MGNCWKKLYEKLQEKQKCPYCKKEKYIDESETAFLISTQGCRVCRIKLKYFYDENKITQSNRPNKPWNKKLSYSTDPFNNYAKNTIKVKGRYY